MQRASLSEVTIAASSEAWRPLSANDPQVVPRPKDGVRKKSFPIKLARQISTFGGGQRTVIKP